MNAIDKALRVMIGTSPILKGVFRATYFCEWPKQQTETPYLTCDSVCFTIDEEVVTHCQVIDDSFRNALYQIDIWGADNKEVGTAYYYLAQVLDGALIDIEGLDKPATVNIENIPAPVKNRMVIELRIISYLGLIQDLKMKKELQETFEELWNIDEDELSDY